MRLARLAGGWVLIGAGAGVVLALALPLLLGARPLTVLSGSMEPALHTGDVAVVQRVAPLETRPGDIVSFRSPNSGALITHRVRRMRVRGDAVQFATRGDANRPVERWQVRRSGHVRVVRYRLPKLGQAFNLLRSRLGLVSLVVLPLGLLLVVELWSIWRPSEPSGEPAA